MLKLLFISVFISILSCSVSFASNYGVDTIKVGNCSLDVYVAKTHEEKRKGMLGFTQKTFNKDGMIFIGNNRQKQYYHTIGMEMNIYIIGVDTIGNKHYKVNDKAVYAPPGKKLITIYGDSVLEIPKKLYEDKFKQCLYRY